MTITLSPEMERVLTKEAARLEKTPNELVEETLREYLSVRRESLDERRARIHALKGSMAHLGPSRLLEDRAEDRAREERNWQK